MSAIDEVFDYLVAQSTSFTVHGGTSGGSLAKQLMLDSTPAPDTIAVLYETAGLANAYTMSTGSPVDVAFERPGLQLLSRSTSYSTARDRAQTAYTILDGLAQTNLPTSTGTLYQDITAQQAPFFLQRDENERWIVAVNFQLRKNV